MRFFTGFIAGILVLLAAFYLFISIGGVSMRTSAPPLPFEQTIARMALRASIGTATEHKNPFKFDDAAMLTAARLYKDECAVCHGIPGGQKTDIAKGMFPEPPQLFERTVVEDPEGETYWKITNGIRLSGMPGFKEPLSDPQRWQLTMLLRHADKLTPEARAAMK